MTTGRLILHRYHTSVDRLGAGIATGGLLCGVMAAVLWVLGGGSSVAGLIGTLAFGWLAGAMAITALGGPVWMALHISGRRGPGHALLLGAVIGFLVVLIAQTHGLGLGEEPPADRITMVLRWASAIATSLLCALAGGAVALVTWRAAYFRIG